MIRKIVEIITEKCIGCMLCINACHEQALILENGKAKLSSSIYCDGLGDCLPHCPTGAIKITEKEALDYDLEKTEEHRTQKQILEKQHSWPYQLKLISPRAPFLNNANILVAADCTAYAYTNFHKDFMIGKVPLIGCPKLDNYDYSKTLEEILIYNDIFTITLVKMEVPCCSGLEVAVKKALNNSGKNIPLIVKTITTKGEKKSIMNEKENILIGKIVGLFRAIDADNSVVLTIDDYELIKQSLLAIKTAKQLDSFIDKITNLKNRLLPDCASCLFPCGRSEDFSINEIRNDKLKTYKIKKVEMLLDDPLLSKMDNDTLFFKILDLERDNNC